MISVYQAFCESLYLYHYNFVILGLCNGTDIEIPLELRDEMTAEMVQGQYTVNSKIIARILFLRNFAYAEFRKNKTLVK